VDKAGSDRAGRSRRSERRGTENKARGPARPVPSLDRRGSSAAPSEAAGRRAPRSTPRRRPWARGRRRTRFSLRGRPVSRARPPLESAPPSRPIRASALRDFVWERERWQVPHGAILRLRNHVCRSGRDTSPAERRNVTRASENGARKEGVEGAPRLGRFVRDPRSAAERGPRTRKGPGQRFGTAGRRSSPSRTNTKTPPRIEDLLPARARHPRLRVRAGRSDGRRMPGTHTNPRRPRAPPFGPRPSSNRPARTVPGSPARPPPVRPAIAGGCRIGSAARRPREGFERRHASPVPERAAFAGRVAR